MYQNDSKEKLADKGIVVKWIGPKTFLGVSQFATAVGLSTKFSTPDELRSQLESGYYKEETEAMRFGTNNEDIAKRLYERLQNVKVIPAKYQIFDSCHRLKGGCDGLIGNDGGIEIKCHYNYTYPLDTIPDYYLIQIAGYMYLYDREWFDFMSCCFGPNMMDGDDNNNGTTNVKAKCSSKITCYNIIRVYRTDIEDLWTKEWFPKLVQFVNSVNWFDQINENNSRIN